MKAIQWSLSTAVLALFTTSMLLSFTTNKGGEGFEIYLNNKLVVQQFGSQVSTVRTIQLDEPSGNDELNIRYYHCGQVGKNRTITIKDDQNKVLKVWHFADGTSAKSGMTCKVKDIVGLRKGKGTITFSLCYSSSELPKGRQLASLVVGSQTMARR